MIQSMFQQMMTFITTMVKPQPTPGGYGYQHNQPPLKATTYNQQPYCLSPTFLNLYNPINPLLILQWTIQARWWYLLDFPSQTKGTLASLHLVINLSTNSHKVSPTYHSNGTTQHHITIKEFYMVQQNQYLNDSILSILIQDIVTPHCKLYAFNTYFMHIANDDTHINIHSALPWTKKLLQTLPPPTQPCIPVHHN